MPCGRSGAAALERIRGRVSLRTMSSLPAPIPPAIYTVTAEGGHRRCGYLLAERPRSAMRESRQSRRFTGHQGRGLAVRVTRGAGQIARRRAREGSSRPPLPSPPCSSCRPIGSDGASRYTGSPSSPAPISGQRIPGPRHGLPQPVSSTGAVQFDGAATVPPPPCRSSTGICTFVDIGRQMRVSGYLPG